MLDLFKSLVRKKERQWCGACLFELNPTAISLSSDIGGRYEYAFGECDYHEFSFADLIKSSKRGCDRCKALVSAFESLGAAGFEVAKWQPNLNSPGSPLLGITIADNTEQVFELCSSEAPLDKPELFAEESPPHAVLCRGYKISRTTGDNEALDQAANWLAECRASHDECRVSDAAFVPSRLLYLGAKRANSNTIELVENLEHPVPYAALSHRWTQETPSISLLGPNLLDRKQHGILITSLPRMMQDIVTVLPRLGIEYVWIDCLCIIQDAEEDWKREAALMASIYTNAELTVAATWCDKAEQSLFRDHSGQQEVAVDVAEADGQSVFIRRRIPHFTWSGNTMADNPEVEWPLLARGWVYQEQLLSRRMLHFTRNELVWECLETTRCECGWYDNNTREQSARERYKQSPRSKAWAKVINGYAKRPLTFVADKLPALAGIGKAVAVERGYDAAEYLCGLWEKELEESFFWYLSEPPCGPRPNLRMPTWSWASVSGDVECWQVSLEDIEFLGSNVVYSGDPLLGDVVSGMMSLSGHVASGVVYHGQDWTNILESQRDATGSSSLLTDWRATEEYGLQIGKQFATFNPDYRLDLPGGGFVPSGSPVLCLLFGRTTSSEYDGSGGSTETVTAHLLILHCVDEAPLRYERLTEIEAPQTRRSTETVFDIASELVKKLKDAGETLGVAESLTAGGVMAAITSVSGASAVFRGGVVSYATPLKEKLLGVDSGLIALEGVIHGDVAKQMAEGARRITGLDDSETTWGIGTTGVAGPSTQDNKPVGMVYIGIAGPNGSSAWGPFSFPGAREQIREATIIEALHLLRELVGAQLSSQH